MMKRKKNQNGGEKKNHSKVSYNEALRNSMISSKIYGNSQQQLEPTIDTASLSSLLVDEEMGDSAATCGSEISSIRSHESLSFIRGKALYNLAQEMNALVDEMQNLDPPSQREIDMKSGGSLSDDDLDNLQRELQNADDAFGGMFLDWDGKSIVVEEGITDIPTTTTATTITTITDQPHNHTSIISLEEESREDPLANANLRRKESNDFQPPVPLKQEHEIHLAPVSLMENTEGLREESKRSDRQTKTAVRQLEEILALVQEENRTLRTEMDQIQEIRTKEEAEYDRNIQDVEDRVLSLMKRLQDKQRQYTDAMKQARDERASLEQSIHLKEEQIAKLELHYQQQSNKEVSRRKKLEKALDTVQRDLERVDSVTSDLVLDDASNNSLSSLHLTPNRDVVDGWVATQDSLSDRIPEALTINHVLHMCQSPPKVSRKQMSPSPPPPIDVMEEIKMRNEKAVQVLTELKTKAQQKQQDSTLPENIQFWNANSMNQVAETFHQESSLLEKQLSIQREIIARLETKQKTLLQTSRQRFVTYESELSQLKTTYDEQLATFAQENESLNQKLATVTCTIDDMKSRHQSELSNLKLERHEIEKEVLLLENQDKFRQENESLSRQLVQYNEALDQLRSVHEAEIKAHQANQLSLVEELQKLQTKYESVVGSFHRQKEILMKKLIDKEREISEIELAQESKLKARQEEKEQLESQLQTLDEKCLEMKEERGLLLQEQKKKLELFSVHLKELKAMQEMERKSANQRICELSEQLGKYEAATVVVEASDTSGTSCVGRMVDEEEDDVQNRTIGPIVADQPLPSWQSYVTIRRTMVLLLVILLLCAHTEQRRVHTEKNSLHRELAILQAQVKEWKIQDAAKDVANVKLQDSLERANSKSKSHQQEAKKLADELELLQVEYKSLQQEHEDHLESYLEETSHEPLPLCFHSPTLAMAASFEEQLKDMFSRNDTAEVLTMDTPLDQDKSLEEDGFLEEESALPAMESMSVRLSNSQATLVELSKAGLEAEFFFVEHLELLSQSEHVVKDRVLRFRDQSVTWVESTVTKMKNRLFPEHRRLIKSEEGIWLDL